jgi:hypothetical protein
MPTNKQNVDRFTNTMSHQLLLVFTAVSNVHFTLKSGLVS